MKYTDLDKLGENEYFAIYGDKNNCGDIQTLLDNLITDKQFIDSNLNKTYDNKINLCFIGRGLKSADFEKAENTKYYRWNVACTMNDRIERTEIMQDYFYMVMGWEDKTKLDASQWWLRDGVKWALINKQLELYTDKNDVLKNLYIINVIKEINNKNNKVEILKRFLKDNSEYEFYSRIKFNYFMVDYLIKTEELNIKDFANYQCDNIEQLLSNMLNYYNKIFDIDNIPKNFENVKNVDDLLLYINANFNFGYVTKDGTFHEGYDDLHKLGKTATMEEILKFDVLNCCDTSRFIKHFLDGNNIENRMFCKYEVNENNEFEAHIFPVFRLNKKDNWKIYEAVSMLHNGIKEYKDLKDLLLDQQLRWWGFKGDFIEIVEQIPDNLSMPELVTFWNNCKKININDKLDYLSNTL